MRDTLYSLFSASCLLYPVSCSQPSTSVESAVQISPFTQNKANFRDAKMNITIFLTMRYVNLDTWRVGKTNPIQTQNKPKQSQFWPIITPGKAKQTQNKPNFQKYGFGESHEKTPEFEDNLN